MTQESLYEFHESYRLFEQAQKFVPGGIYGPRSPHFLAFGQYPAFIQRGKGCYIWDVDGNQYIDYMCSFGTNLLGMGHPAVEKAAAAQREKGDCFTLPSDLWVPMAEKMTRTIQDMDWLVFGKNGSDVTTHALTVARVFTGKKLILKARGSYHGSHFWCHPPGEGVPAEWRSHVAEFDYNNVQSLKAAADRADDDLAGVILTPHRHDALADQELPSKEFVRAVNNLKAEKGCCLIMDDIRCGFRIDIRGSHALYGFDADLACFGKAMANGYPIAVAMGRAGLKEAAQKIFFTGTHFFSAVPFAAAMATLDEIRASGAIEKIKKMGTALMDGLAARAAARNVGVTLSGPPAMPYMTFANDPAFEKNRFFCGAACRRGVFFHPHHNWFVCAALSKEDLDKTLDVAEICFQQVKEQFDPEKKGQGQ